MPCGATRRDHPPSAGPTGPRQNGWCHHGTIRADRVLATVDLHPGVALIQRTGRSLLADPLRADQCGNDIRPAFRHVCGVGIGIGVIAGHDAIVPRPSPLDQPGWRLGPRGGARSPGPEVALRPVAAFCSGRRDSNPDTPTRTPPAATTRGSGYARSSPWCRQSGSVSSRTQPRPIDPPYSTPSDRHAVGQVQSSVPRNRSHRASDPGGGSVRGTAAARLIGGATPVGVRIHHGRRGGRAHLAGGMAATSQEHRRTDRGQVVAAGMLLQALGEVGQHAGKVGAHVVPCRRRSSSRIRSAIAS